MKRNHIRLCVAALFLQMLMLGLGLDRGHAQTSEQGSFRIDCSQPKDVNEVAVCEQSKANKIAEKALNLNEKQTYISSVGFAGLLITIVISIIGSVLTFFTLKFSRTQTSILKDTLTQERRAWIKVELESRGPMCENETGCSVEIAVKITNIGSSPAFNIYTNVDFVKIEQFNDVSDAVKKFALKSIDYAVNDGKILLPEDSYYRPWAPSFEKNENIMVFWILLVCVSYRILNSEKVHQTVVPYIQDEWDHRHGNAQLIQPHFAQFTAWGGGFAS